MVFSQDVLDLCPFWVGKILANPEVGVDLIKRKKAVLADPVVNKSGLKARLNLDNDSLVDIAFDIADGLATAVTYCFQIPG